MRSAQVVRKSVVVAMQWHAHGAAILRNGITNRKPVPQNTARVIFSIDEKRNDQIEATNEMGNNSLGSTPILSIPLN